MLHVSTPEFIRQGGVVDAYFVRTKEILEAKGLEATVRMEVSVKDLPAGWSWGVLAGLEELAWLTRNLDVRIRSLPEGSIFETYQPVMDIEGRYLDFGHLETAILGLLCQASGVATMAARCRKAAGKKTLFSFGARRMHPAIAPMLERNAYIGGCDGVAVEAGAALVGLKPVGTMPHALIIIMGDTVEALQAFDQVIDPSVPRVALVDTFQDERFEAVRVAKALGDRLWGIRLDTPRSRRGDLARIVEEVRWELNRAGFSHVQIMVSGGLDECEVAALNPFVDGFGVGTAISNAPVVDFSMDIVEIDQQPVSKRGVKSGAKDLYRCTGCRARQIMPAGQTPPPCSCGHTWDSLLLPLDSAKPVARDIRNHVLRELAHYELSRS